MKRPSDREHASHDRPRQNPRRPIRLLLEPLEARRLLAGLNVSVVIDQDGSRRIDAADTPAARRVVYLDLNSNGQHDASDPVAFTNELGIASFDDLAAGDYAVGIADGNSFPSQTFPIRVDEIATQLGPAAKTLLASGDLSQVWAIDGSGRGRLLSPGPSASDTTVQLGGGVVASVNVGGDAWLITETFSESGSPRGAESPRTGQTSLVQFNLSSGRHTSSEIHGLAGRVVDKLIQAGSQVFAQLNGPRGIELAKLTLVAGVPTIGTSAAFPNLVAVAGNADQQLAILESLSENRALASQPTATHLSVLSSEDFSVASTSVLSQPADEIAFSSDGSLVLAAYSLGGVIVLNNDQHLTAVAKLAEASVPLLTQSRDGRLVTGNSTDAAEFIVWDTQVWQPVGRTRLTPTSMSPEPIAASDALLATAGDRLIATGTAGTAVAQLARAAPAPVKVPSEGRAAVQLAVRVNTANSAPAPTQINRSTPEDTPLSGQLRSDVTDADRDSLWFRALTSPSHGRLDVLPTGQWNYRPSDNFNGVDRATLQVFDGQAASEVVLILNVSPVNDPPEEMQIELPTTLAENTVGSVAGDALGYATVFDVEIGSQYQFHTSDPRFQVLNGRVYLVPGAMLDFESEPSIELEIIATEDAESGYQISTTTTLSIADVNEPPTAVRILNTTVSENSPGATIGQIQVDDPDFQDQFTFVVSDSRFIVDGDQLKLQPGIALDFEESSVIRLNIAVADAHGQSLDQEIDLVVADQNDPPTGISAQLQTLEERTAGAVVGTVAIHDQDGQAYRYTVSDPRFEVVDGQLKLKEDQTVDRATDSALTLTVTASSITGNDSISSTLAVAVGAKKSPHQNPVEPRDVNGDGEITPLDALLLINYINSFGPGPLGGSAGRGGSGEAPAWVDVNGDGVLSPLDILIIINWLNRRRSIVLPIAEGEASAAVGGSQLAGSMSAGPGLAMRSAQLSLHAVPSSVIFDDARDPHLMNSTNATQAKEFRALACPAPEAHSAAHIDRELETLLDHLTLERLNARGA